MPPKSTGSAPARNAANNPPKSQSAANEAQYYVPPPQILSRLVSRGTDAQGNPVVAMPADVFTKLLEAALAPGFDEVTYLSAHEDIRQGVESGIIGSGLRHFAAYGFFEGRAPVHFAFDSEWYRATYPDVERAIQSGQVHDAAHHFEAFGYAEGRVPCREFQSTVAEWHQLLSARSLKGSADQSAALAKRNAGRSKT